MFGRLFTNNIAEIIKAVVISTIIVSILGYIDYITGEISVDVLYILCICAVTWYTNIFIGFLCILEIIVSKISADYYCNIKIGAHLYESNIINFVLISIIICFLSGTIKKLLSK